MPNELYLHDALAWSEQQADLLRRFGRGERVNGIDWDNVAEEIEDVGLSELRAVKISVRQILIHLLKLSVMPDDLAAAHWRGEIVEFQAQLGDAFMPSMRQRLDLSDLYAVALRRTRLATKGAALPIDCPVVLDDLLSGDPEVLEAAFAGATPQSNA